MEGVSKLSRTSGKRATNNFDDKLFIGQGSYGKVYKGLLIDDRSCTINVAIKCVTFDRLRTELPLACQLYHPNHVPLVGYCLDDQQMILVYKFMVKGNLGDHLYSSTNHNDPLPWKLLKMQSRKNSVMIKLQLRKNALVMKTTKTARRKES